MFLLPVPFFRAFNISIISATNMYKINRQFLLFLFILLYFTGFSQNPFIYVPPTVSPEWQHKLQTYTNPCNAAEFPAANNVNAWQELYNSTEIIGKSRSEITVKKFMPVILADTFDNVPVLDIRSRKWKDNGKVLIYLHGGAFTLLSSSSTQNISALMAEITGLRVISVDYTVAPKGKWNTVTDEVIRVIKSLLKIGYELNDIAFFGDSAGGGLATSVTLKMRDLGLGMPSALVLFSPWADVTETGDSYVTLKDADPLLCYDNKLKPSALAYADSADQKNPYVSPVYGDFTKGFPPTLIQGGTKEIFLSNFVRLYQAIDIAGNIVKLDLYEGMVHNFQSQLPDSPEAQMALEKAHRFLKQHLSY